MDRPSLDAVYAMVVDDALGTLPPRVQAGLGALTVATALWAAARPAALRVVAFCCAAFFFGRANHAFEGPVLVSFTPGHGLVLADLLPVALLGLVVVRALVLSDGAHRVPAACRTSGGGYGNLHGVLRVRLRPALVAAAAVPRGPARHRARRGR